MKLGLKFQSLDLLSKNLYFFNDSLFKIRKQSQHEEQMQMLSHFQKNLTSTPSQWEAKVKTPQASSRITDNDVYSKFKEMLNRSFMNFKGRVRSSSEDIKETEDKLNELIFEIIS